MLERAARWTSLFAFTALLSGTSGAFASSVAAESMSPAASQEPALLAPIDREGRNGWKCDAERAARAQTGAGAELPTKP